MAAPDYLSQADHAIGMAATQGTEEGSSVYVAVAQVHAIEAVAAALYRLAAAVENLRSEPSR